MSRIVIYRGTGTISIQGAGDLSRTIRMGDSVNLDEVLLPGTEDRPAITVEDALGLRNNDRFQGLFESPEDERGEVTIE